MDKSIRKFTSFDEAKADEYRYWQSRPVHERMEEVSRLSSAMYAMKSEGTDAPRLDKNLVRIGRLPQ